MELRKSGRERNAGPDPLNRQGHRSKIPDQSVTKTGRLHLRAPNREKNIVDLLNGLQFDE